VLDDVTGTEPAWTASTRPGSGTGCGRWPTRSGSLPGASACRPARADRRRPPPLPDLARLPGRRAGANGGQPGPGTSC
jgi:hypothetical protein